jgi:site-specific DNA recombinase
MSATNGNGTPPRVGGYCRTSGEGQRDNTSIPTQREGIEAACAANGWRLVRHYVDECKSGAKTDGRDAFKRMLKDAMNGELDILVPYDAKRFARDGVDIMDTAKMLKGTFGVVVVDSKGQFDNRDHRNTLRNFVEAGVSEHERLTIMERTLGARVKKARAGLPWSGNPPFGRVYRKTCGCVRKCKCVGEWQVDERGKAMEALLKEYVSGKPYTARDGQDLSYSLKELAPRYGFYSASHVQSIIHNGQLAARPYVVVFNTPEIGIENLKVEVPAVPPVISADLERRVLDRMLHNRQWNKQALKKSVLASFLRCSCCKYSLMGTTINRNVYYDHNRYARTSAAAHDKVCPFRRIPASAVEGVVLDYLYSWFVDQPAFDMAVKLALPSGGERQQRQDEIRQVQADLDRVEKEIGRLVDAILKGADPSLLTSKQDELKARKEALTVRRQELQGEIATMPDPDAMRVEADIIRVRLAREQGGKDWHKESFDDVRRFLHFLFGDNPRKEGLGIYVNRQGGQWTTEIRARLRLRAPVTVVYGVGTFPSIGGTEGETDYTCDFWGDTGTYDAGAMVGEREFPLGEPYGDNS